MNLHRTIAITILSTVLLSASQLLAQDEVPTKVTNQNRSGELPFADSVGTGAEHVDLSTGTLNVEIPIVSIPGRGLNSQLYYRFNSNYFLLAPRIDGLGHPYYLWTIENNAGWQTNQTATTHVFSRVKCDPVNGQDEGYANLDTNYIYTDDSGAKHPLAVQSNSGYCAGPGDSTGPDLTGEGMSGTLSSLALGDVALADGTQVVPQNGTWTDSNGNIRGGNTTDTLGRSFYSAQQTTDSNGNPVQTTYTVTDSNGNPQTYTVNWQIINISTNFQNSSNSYGPVKEMNPSNVFLCCPWNVVHSIVLPNNLTYTFKYDDGGYGEIIEIDLPTGAVITYTYANLQNDRKTRRYVASRTETINGVSSTWNLSIVPTLSPNLEADQYTSTVTYPLVGNPPVSNQSVFSSTSGSLSDTKIYAGSAQGTPAREYVTNYAFDTDPWADDSCYNSDLFGPQDPQAVGARLLGITTILENGLQSRKEFDYETFTYVYHPNHCTFVLSGSDSSVAKTYTTSRGNVTEIREYDWGQGAPGPLIRKTDKTYLHNSNSAYLTRNIVSKVLQETIYDNGSNQIAQTQYEFDNYIAGVNPLISTSGAPAAQHDYTNYSSSFIYRANATRVKKWRNTDNVYLTTIYTYDDLGNIRAIQDPLTNTTSYSYTDAWANSSCPTIGGNGQAYVTQITNAANQHTNLTYFPCTGLTQAHQDQNDINARRAGTTYIYDLMNRPSTVNYPDNGQTSFNYHGDALPLTATKSVLATPDPSIMTSTIQDGLGRTSQTTIDSLSPPVVVDITYDALGRKLTESNPHTNVGSSTDGVTTYQYDVLDRVSGLTRQDGSVVNTAYSANVVTVTDEAGNQRRNTTDALGRLIEVDEPGDAFAGTAASGGLTISGSLQNIPAKNATPGTGSVTVSGTEQSKQVLTHAATGSSGTITVSGTEQRVDPGDCPGRPPCYIYDAGTVSVSVNGGAAINVNYGQTSTSSWIASAVAVALNNSYGSILTASASGSVVTVTSKQTGSSTNYSWSTSVTYDSGDFLNPSFTVTRSGATLTGGTDNVYSTLYDSGTCTVTVNGTQYQKTFGQSDSTGTIASGLANVISGGSLTSAASSGGTINLTAKSTGASTDYSLSSSCSYDSTDFSGPSFSAAASGNSLTGGTNATSAVTDAGTVQISIGGYSATVNYGNGSGQDSTSAAVASDLVGKIQAQLPSPNPPFAISANGAGITVNWNSVGTAGNVTVTTTSTTNQTAYFSTPSFASCSITANPQNCSTNLSGGQNAYPSGLAHPYVTQYKYDVLDNLFCLEQHGDATGTACPSVPFSPSTPVPPDSTNPWHLRRFAYNSLSQLAWSSNPESGVIVYTYDGNGNLLQKTSPAPNQTGTSTQTVSNCYDALNRVTGKAYSAQTCLSGPTGPESQLPSGTAVVSYTYDSGSNGIGHLTSLADQAGSGSYTHDAMGRVLTESRTITPGGSLNPVTNSMSYQYNVAGGIDKLTYPSQAVVTYALEGGGHDISAIDSGNGINYVTSATYAPPGGLTGFVSGQSNSFSGISNAMQYNARLQTCRITALTTGSLPTSCTDSTHTGNVLDLGYNLSFGAGDNGNVLGITNYKDNTRSQTFTYDSLNRLTSAQNAGTDCSATPHPLNPNQAKFWGNNYVYDAWGNLLQKNVSKCKAENLLVTVSNNRNQIDGFCYDAAGNLVNQGACGPAQFTYDQENRITGAGGDSYIYDADGNRVEKCTAGGTAGTCATNATGTIYWYMSPGIVAESDLSGNLKSEYVFFNGERVARRDNPGPNATVVYYFSDQLKTTDIVTDAAGNILNESDYYPWGGELEFSANDSNHYKFTGKERDTETGLDYFGARYYSNGLGRFITPDWSAVPVPVPYADLTDPQSLDQYSYVRNRPMSRTDPTGHCEIDGEKHGILWCIGHALGWNETKKEEKARLDEEAKRRAQREAERREFIRQYGYDPYLVGAEMAMAYGAIYASWGGGYAPPSSPEAGAPVEEEGGNGARTGGTAGVDVNNLSNKIVRQMGTRGWTKQEILDTVQNGKAYSVTNKATGGTATEYVNSSTGKFVVVDDATKQVLQVSGPGFLPNHLVP